VIEAEARIASDQQSLLVAQAQLAELTSSANQSAAQAQLAAAQAQVATAQAALDDLTSEESAAGANAQLAAAEAAARSAQAALEELTPDAKAQGDCPGRGRQGAQAAQASLAAILNLTAAALARQEQRDGGKRPPDAPRCWTSSAHVRPACGGSGRARTRSTA
jgi:hypothetical protein